MAHSLVHIASAPPRDRNLMRFLFRHASGSWKFAFSSHGTADGTSMQRRLARACH